MSFTTVVELYQSTEVTTIRVTISEMHSQQRNIVRQPKQQRSRTLRCRSKSELVSILLAISLKQRNAKTMSINSKSLDHHNNDKEEQCCKHKHRTHCSRIMESVRRPQTHCLEKTAVKSVAVRTTSHVIVQVAMTQ
uniref:Uncharacterized protein n=1 Tax=Lygus hesperus TaxID=30085 RepID=A0A146LX93_LYGHE